MVIKTGRFGRFISCSGYPECKTTKPIVKDTGAKCPKDGGTIVERRSKKGRTFYGCAQLSEVRLRLVGSRRPRARARSAGRYVHRQDAPRRERRASQCAADKEHDVSVAALAAGLGREPATERTGAPLEV